MAPNFDPFQQSVTFQRGDGSSFPVSMADFDKFLLYVVRTAIAAASQLGASVVMAVLLALLTSPEKRRSIVFYLNITTLLMNVCRTLSSAVFFTSSWVEVYAYFSGDYFRVTAGAYANSVMGTIATGLMVILIELSLLVQTQVLCSTLCGIYRVVLLAWSCVVAMVPIAFRIVLVVENIKAVMSQSSLGTKVWIQSSSNITISVSICYFSLIFMAKLGYAIYTRRALGMTGFGVMQVIFIMACQTMMLPAIMSILQYFIPEFEINTNILTLLALSLPLTTLWSAAAVRHIHNDNNHGPGRHIWGGSSGKYFFDQSKNSGGSFSHPASTLVGTMNGSEKIKSADHFDRLYPELNDAGPIAVDRNFSVTGDRV
ncbi:mating-type alpha-pheromone receptor PreB [Arthroderma uncinatum]|uniref:mating-type alpha-pheromone receptor PreB n=1 Tax=Arthroderma uncinatum TaxID=74035 RepID=UPI00144AA4BD|nr:mating-type alpha-pheromone receptor PreB [Arthroderma uncinatum]KAF3491052.1 mating-type alpha-pheromone receptor PreB [Arthroderma uncinatum]